MNGDVALELYHEGRRLLDSGDRSGGIEKLRAAARAAPHFKTYEILGEALLAESRHSEAVLCLSAAVGLGRRQPRARYLLAQALSALGPEYLLDAALQLVDAMNENVNYRSAREMLDKLTREHPDVANQLKEHLSAP